jgi:mannose-1-phosphate guanylyltransferase / phosphomannomutase
VIPIVLAGGSGTRIRPLSANRPKPMLPVVNRPILERVLDHLRANGFTEAVLVTYHDPSKVRNFFGDGAWLGMRLHYHQSDQDFGTGGAVVRGAATLDTARYLVVSGDVLCRFDLGELEAAHEEAGAALTIALTRVPNPLQFGIVTTDADGRVRRFLEKPTWGEVFSDTVNAGIYVVERDVLREAPATEAFDFSGDFFPRLLEAGRPLYGHVARGYWRDVGDPEAYLAAHRDFFAGVIDLEPPGKLREIGGRQAWVDGESDIDPGVEVRGTVVIGPGCIVRAGARLEDVVLGAGTVISEGAELRGTVTWAGAVVGAGARIEASVLGDRVRVGDASFIEPGAVIADDTTIGRGVRVKEGIRIWAAKVVEDHAVVHANLVYAERWRTSAFEEGAVTGLTNLELTPDVAARLGAAYGTLLAPGSTVLTVRDAHPASRMLRRAFVGGVGSSGVHVVDLGMLPVPAMRHKLESFGEVGGVSFQQVQGARGMTSIRFFAEQGLDISRSFAKSVERVFMREEFRRAPHQEVGVIFEHPRLVDFYAESYLHALEVEAITARHFRLVVDNSHSAAVVVLPALLAKLGCDVVTLNAHTEGFHEASLVEEMEQAQRRLATIVTALDADLGVWLHPGAERLALADRGGRLWRDMELTALVVAAVAAARLPAGEVVLPGYAPSSFRPFLETAGHSLRETLSAPRALTEASRVRRVLLATSGDGDLIFPRFHHAPDALFAVGAVLELLARSERTLAEVAATAPPVRVARAALDCPLERKGEVMRRFVEGLEGEQTSFLEGVKVFFDGGWVLLRPDRVAPRLHLHAEGNDEAATAALLANYRSEVEELIRST